jgi:hypothetical protein
MSLNWPQCGEYHVPAYQMSALPYLTSSIISLGEIHRYDFQNVTKFINIVNRGGTSSDKIALAFTEHGFKTGNYITLDAGDTVHEEIRTTALYISGSYGAGVDYQIFCGLTIVPARNFTIITGSNGHQGVG